MKNLVIFGDSHSRIFKHIRIPNLNIEVNNIRGATIIGLPKRISTLNLREKIINYLKNNKVDYLILKFGQVDLELGYYYKLAVKKEKFTKDDFIANLILNYTIFLNIIQKYIDKSKIIVWGVNPSALLDDVSFLKYTSRIIFEKNDTNYLKNYIEDNKIRNKFLLNFNYECRKMCENNDFKYIEVFSDLLTKEGKTSKYFTNNNDHHLKGIENDNSNFKSINNKFNIYLQKIFPVFKTLNLNETINDITNRYINSHYEITGILKPYLKNMKKDKNNFHSNILNYDTLYNLNICDEEKKDILLTFPLREGDIVLELGAYRGLGSIKLSEIVGTSGKVIAVEGMKDNFTILCNNIKNNNILNIIPINCFSSNKNKSTTLFSKSNQVNTINSNLKRDWSKHSIINVYKIDDILQAKKIYKVTYITLEINLEEYNALLGLEQTLKSNNYIRIVAAAWYSEELRIKMIKYLKSLNFKVYIGVCNRLYAIKNI